MPRSVKLPDNADQQTLERCPLCLRKAARHLPLDRRRQLPDGRERDSGEPVAMLDRCPHRFAYLSKGRRIGDEVECVYHGLRFGPDGRCTHSPYQDGPPPEADVQTFPLVEWHKGHPEQFGIAGQFRMVVRPEGKLVAVDAFTSISTGGASSKAAIRSGT